MTRKPFVLRVLFGGLVFVGPALLILLAQVLLNGSVSNTDPFLLILLVLAGGVFLAVVASLGGMRWSYAFTTPGTYSYHCMPHPHTMGQVIVTNSKERAEPLRMGLAR